MRTNSDSSTTTEPAPDLSDEERDFVATFIGPGRFDKRRTARLLGCDAKAVRRLLDRVAVRRAIVEWLRPRLEAGQRAEATEPRGEP